MPRAAWLAVGAAAAALVLAGTGPVALLLTGSALLLAGSGLRFTRRSAAWRRLAPVAVGVVVIGLRSATSAEAPPPGPPPSGDGPWIATVQSVGAPRAGHKAGDRAARGDPPVIVAATLPYYPPVVPGDRVGPDRQDPAATRGRLRRLPGPDQRGRDAARGHARGAARLGLARRRARRHSPGRRGGPRSRNPRARGGSGRGRADRAPGPRRPRPGRGVHDGRREPRGRHLRLEHRHRRVHARGHRRGTATTPAGNPHGGRDRPVRGVRGAIGISRPRWRDGRRRPAGSRAGPSRDRRRGTRLGRHRPAARRPGLDRRRGLPPVGAGDRRDHRVGLLDDRAALRRRAGAAPALARRDPRRLAGRTGGHDTDRAARVRAALARGAGGQPDRRAARPTGDGRRGSRARRRRARWPGAAVDPCRPRRLAGLGPLCSDGRSRAVRRRAAPREHRAGTTLGLDQRIGIAPRDPGRRALGWPAGCREDGRGSRSARDRRCRAGGRPPVAPRIGGFGSPPWRSAVPSSGSPSWWRTGRMASRASSSSTWGRATGSSSRAGAAAGWWSTADPIRDACSSRWTSDCRRGTAGSTCSC